ncbi:MAG: OsmC family protein [Azoarcus sp.]|nr:OsmC family protein [Azoarcus sp.]
MESPSSCAPWSCAGSNASRPGLYPPAPTVAVKSGETKMEDATSKPTQKMTFSVRAKRVDAHGSEAQCKSAQITLDTDLAGRTDAFNPAELLLAALAACMIKGIERITPILKFDLRGVEIRIHGVRQDVPPKMESISYEILVDTDESAQRLKLLHDNVKKYGTVFNTVAPGTMLSGDLRRTESPASPSRQT